MELDEDLIEQVLRGNRTAIRIYCGSYTLIKETETGFLFRLRGDEIPQGYTKCNVYGSQPVYDLDGFLYPEFWSLPRMG